MNRSSGSQGGSGASAGGSTEDAETGQAGFDVAGLSSLEEEEAAKAYNALMKDYGERAPHVQLSVPYWVSNRAMLPLVIGREANAKEHVFRASLQPVHSSGGEVVGDSLSAQGRVIARGGHGVVIDMHGRDAAAEAALVSMLGLPTIEAKHGLVGMTLLSGSNDALS